MEEEKKGTINNEKNISNEQNVNVEIKNEQQIVMEQPVVMEQSVANVNQDVNNEVQPSVVQEELKEVVTNQKKKGKGWIVIVVLIIIAAIVGGYLYLNKDKKENNNAKPNIQETDSEPFESSLDYTIKSNGLENFDLAFMQMNNNNKNLVYSPLSIKYALFMLADAANGETKEEIAKLTGEYKPNKYVNSSNMSFANAMFIKDSFKDNVKNDYINTISSKYNGDVVYDSFANPDNVNKWVSDKTLNNINNMFDNVSDNDFILLNALAIDMEWVNQFMYEFVSGISFANENYGNFVSGLISRYPKMTFDNKYDVANVEVAATLNNYDIIKDLGEENIRKTVGDAWDEYYSNPENEKCLNIIGTCDKEVYLDKYIEDINKNYKQKWSSTDFELYTDDTVQVFAKDLKGYNGMQLQYVAIMPKDVSLNEYIKNIDASKLNDLINNLKTIELNNFNDGVITDINGTIPMFQYEAKLDLIKDLKKLGVNKTFDKSAADLSNLSPGAYIKKVNHKANIEFSNEGIKAAAVTSVGGAGAATGGFYYEFDVPVEKIELNFDKPYMYIIRDTKSGEVWFAGTVYEPCEYESYNNGHMKNS